MVQLRRSGRIFGPVRGEEVGRASRIHRSENAERQTYQRTEALPGTDAGSRCGRRHLQECGRSGGVGEGGERCGEIIKTTR